MDSVRFKISLRDTSRKKVKRFLRRNKDESFLHQFPIEILPGMYYLHLASRKIENFMQISKVSLGFKGIRKYPILGLEVIIERENGKQKFNFQDNEELAGVEIEYAGNGITYDNIERLNLVRAIPGDLLRFTGELGAYMGQTLNFLEQPDENTIPQFNYLRKGTRNILIETKYCSDGRVIATGRAYTLALNPEIKQAIAKASNVQLQMIDEILERYKLEKVSL